MKKKFIFLALSLTWMTASADNIDVPDEGQDDSEPGACKQCKCCFPYVYRPVVNEDGIEVIEFSFKAQ